MLQTLLAEPELAGLPLLVFANKQDLPFAMSISAVIDGLKLHGTSDRKWHVQGCNSISGDGLYEGLEWFTTVLKSTGEK
jgi:signal recognition particle receptor subunit beta